MAVRCGLKILVLFGVDKMKPIKKETANPCCVLPGVPDLTLGSCVLSKTWGSFILWGQSWVRVLNHTTQGNADGGTGTPHTADARGAAIT